MKLIYSNLISNNYIDEKEVEGRFCDLRLYPVSRNVRYMDKTIYLTQKEFSLLELLLLNRNKVLSREVIAEKVWNTRSELFTNIVDVYICYLRKKINHKSKKLIHTVRYGGYVLKI